MQKGFPVITFEYDNKNGRVTLTQKHFVLTTSKDSRYKYVHYYLNKFYYP